MKQFIKLASTLLALAMVLIFTPKTASAHGTHKSVIDSAYTSRIIDDPIFIDKNTMSISTIQSFLNQKVPVCQSGFTCLKDYSQGGKSAARIIYDTAQEFNINPRVILVTLQKEQSLVTDDWPTDIQYKTAMGYGCPESETTCNSEYYGFTNQVRLGTKLLRVGHDRFCGNNTSYPGWSMGASWYANDADGKNPYTIDGKSTTVLTCATASLYNYTPHRVDSGYLTAGDGGHYYGNYNFVTTFQNWFGTTWVAVQWMKSSGSATEYVVYDGKKQPIGSPDTREAWNIRTLNGGTPEVWSTDRVSNTPTHNFGNLSRKVRRVNTDSYFFIDGGGYFKANSSSVRKLWSFPSTPSYITPPLLGLVEYSGNLSPYATDDTATIYLVDNNKLYPISNPTVLHAWYNGEGINSISGALVSQMTISSVINHNRITSGSDDWLVSDGKRLKVPTDLATQYPHTPFSVSQDVIGYLKNVGQVSRFVRSSNGGGVYIVDSGGRHGLPNTESYGAYHVNSDPHAGITNLDARALSLITEGALWRSALVKNGSNYYQLTSNQKRPIPANAQSLFDINNHSTTVSSELLSRFSTGANITPFVTSSNNPAVFLLDSGTRRGISNPRILAQLRGASPITVLTNYDLDSFTYIDNLTAHLGDGTNQYFFDNGLKHQVTDNSIRDDWGLSNSTLKQVATSTLNYFSSSGVLGRKIKIGADYYVISNKTYYRTRSAAMINIWGLTTAPTFTSHALYGLPNYGELTRFVATAGSNTLYTINSGELLAIKSVSAFRNLGYAGERFVNLSGAHTTSLYGSKLFHGYLIKKDDNSTVVLDQGKIRSIKSGYETNWKGTFTPTALSNSYLALLGSDTTLEKSIKGPSSATIYGLDAGQKRPLGATEFRISYYPNSNVSSYLIDLIPNVP